MTNRVRFILLIIIFCISFGNVESGEYKHKFFVNADGGLRLRENPDTESQMIILIPDGTEVETIEVSEKDSIIAGISSRWFKVIYLDKTGWVFGGFLESKKLKNCTTLNNTSMEIFIDWVDIIENNVRSKLYFAQSGPGEAGYYFTLNKTGKGELRSSDSRIGEKYPVFWKIEDKNVIIEGDYTTKPIFYPAECGFYEGYKKCVHLAETEKNACFSVENKNCFTEATNNYFEANKKKYGKPSATIHFKFAVTFESNGIARIRVEEYDTNPISLVIRTLHHYKPWPTLFPNIDNKQARCIIKG